MRFVIRHDGFIKGQPPRYRHVGEMPVKMETPVELRKVAGEDAPVVYRREDLASPTKEFRFHDGSFYRLTDHSKLEDALHGSINVEELQRYSAVTAYKARCDWHSFSSHGIGARGVLPKSRALHDWKASNIDTANAHVFSDAVTALAGNFIMIGSAMWERCFEPCLEVRWTPSISGTGVLVSLRIGDTGNGETDIDQPGPQPLPMNAYDRLVPFLTPHEHLRCFSAIELERADAFINGLKKGMSAHRVSRNEGQRLVVVEPSLASPDFDALEIRRSAKIHISALRAMTREIKSLKDTQRVKAIFEQDEYGNRSAPLEAVLAAYEVGDAPPEDVLDAMVELKKVLRYASNAFFDRHQISIATYVPPDYFGDVDSFAVDLNIFAARSISPNGPR
jgi:hypothetical protein